MLIKEMENMMDVLYNNITSNQAPGLNPYEKSVFLTKAEKEVVLNHFSANSKGNNLGQGFDDSAKRQADFSVLMKTGECQLQNNFTGGKIDRRSKVFSYPSDVFVVVNESIDAGEKILQVIPLRFDEYTRLMSKPFKRPLRDQAWRLMNSGEMANDTSTDKGKATKFVEVVVNAEDENNITSYKVRYVRMPKPIILMNLASEGLSIDGQTDASTECELDPILHEEVVQRAVELAKIAWTSTGQDNAQGMVQAGQRSE